MKLILQKDVKNLGKVGEIVRVKDGYARNYLLPQKMALVLNESSIKNQKHQENIIRARKKQALSDRQALLESLNKITLSFERESHNDGRLFGSVSPVDISKSLEMEHKMLVDKKDIQSPLIKEVGEHLVNIVLDADNKTDLKVVVTRKKVSKKGLASDEGKSDGKRSFFSKVFSKGSSEEEQTAEQTTEPTPDESISPAPLEEVSNVDTVSTEDSSDDSSKE